MLKIQKAQQQEHNMKLKEITEKQAKPDFLDIDNDGNKKEPMKQASKDAKKDNGDKKKKDLSKVPPQLRAHMKGESIISEAPPTKFIPTHYGGPMGINLIMHHTDNNLYFQKPKEKGGGREIVRWNGNPSGEGFFGKWNPATIKGIYKNGQKIPYSAGQNFTNAPKNIAGQVSGTKPGQAGSSNLVRKGSKGADVKEIQTKLGIAADGIFGPNTEKAVMDFQKKNGLKVDGIVGPNTKAALDKIGSGAVQKSKVPPPRPDSIGKPRDLDAIDAEREKQAKKGVTDPAARAKMGIQEPNPNRPKGSTAPSVLRLNRAVIPDIDSWLSKYGVDGSYYD